MAKKGLGLYDSGNEIYDLTPITWPGEPKDFTSTAYTLVLMRSRRLSVTPLAAGRLPGTARCSSMPMLLLLYMPGMVHSTLSNATVTKLINSVTPAAYAIGDKVITVTIAATEGYAGDGVVAAMNFVADTSLSGMERRLQRNVEPFSTIPQCLRMVEYPDYPGRSYRHHTRCGSGCECPGNPYRYVSQASTSYAAVMGVPVVYAAATYNVWLQTAGPCWCSPGGGDASPGDTAGDGWRICGRWQC